jgi:hypothetical protein
VLWLWKKVKKVRDIDPVHHCGLWCHKECAGISNEFLKFLEEQKNKKTLASPIWGCRSCIVYAQGMNHCLKEMEKRLKSAHETGKKNESDIMRMEKREKKLEEKLKNKIGSGKEAVFEEMSEREAKRLNVIIHGVQEYVANETTSEKRIEWDMKEMEEIFKVLEFSFTKEDMKFSRGEERKEKHLGQLQLGLN